MNTSTFTHKLRLVNDNVNDLYQVPSIISGVLNITREAAEQHAYHTHYEGSTILKYGTEAELKMLCDQLNIKGLIAEIEISTEPEQ